MDTIIVNNVVEERVRATFYASVMIKADPHLLHNQGEGEG